MKTRMDLELQSMKDTMSAYYQKSYEVHSQLEYYAHINYEGFFCQGICKPPTDLTNTFSGSVKTESEGRYSFNCAADGIEAMQRTIKKYPIFPFSYAGLALCLNASDHAEKAVAIEKLLVKTLDHLTDHDEILTTLCRNFPDKCKI